MKKTLATLATIGIIGAGAFGVNQGWKIKPHIPPKNPHFAFLTANIENEEKLELATYGEYIQVTKDGRQLTKNGQVNSTVKGQLPANTEVHVYESPQGKGYEIIKYNATSTEHVGFGPEAAERTYTVTFNTSTATSTP